MPLKRRSVTWQQRLLRWFVREQRDLPWRRDRDPYHIWLSEAMLQQTQVATVVSYFERFVTALPTIKALAAAEEQEVLRLWEGLGYYRRARHLHRAARQIVSEHRGRFPKDVAACAALPGVGRYMVGAILSQAFDQRLPIVEANSKRVLCRLFAHTGDSKDPATQRWLWEKAEEVLPRRHVGDFNQALMELGALLCTPKTPRCSACPLSNACAARRGGLQESIPAPPAPPRIVEVREAAVVLRRGLRVLLVQRPDGGRWAGLWEFPHDELKRTETHEHGARRLARTLTGFHIGALEEVLTLRHGVTRFRITMVCFEAQARGGNFRSSFYQKARWLRPEELTAYPVSSPQRRLANALRVAVRQKSLF
jgi:A/G-specific adenine glycosylase